VRQGDTLSPILFILTLQLALDRVNWEHGIRLGERILGHLDFADDLVLCSRTLEGLQSLLNQVADRAREVGLHINVQKTKWMSNVPILYIWDSVLTGHRNLEDSTKKYQEELLLAGTHSTKQNSC
jgi:hypothetical protein